MAKAKKVEETKEVVKYTKEQILKSAIFVNRKDAVGVVVGDNELLTLDEVAERIEKFMKGKVN